MLPEAMVVTVSPGPQGRLGLLGQLVLVAHLECLGSLVRQSVRDNVMSDIFEPKNFGLRFS